MTIRKFDKHVGQKLRLARKNSNYSQKTVAQLLHIDINKVSRIERGEQSAEFQDIVQFSRLYNTSLYYFLEDFSNKKKP